MKVFIKSKFINNTTAGIGLWWGNENSERNISVQYHEHENDHCRVALRGILIALQIDQYENKANTKEKVSQSDDKYRLYIHTTNINAINFIKRYTSIWLKNGWRKQTGEVVENKELLLQIHDILEKDSSIQLVFVDKRNAGVRMASHVLKGNATY